MTYENCFTGSQDLHYKLSTVEGLPVGSPQSDRDLVRRLRWPSAATASRHEITARPRIKCPDMIRIALTDAAYDAIASTLPKGAARWPMQRDRAADRCVIVAL